MLMKNKDKVSYIKILNFSGHFEASQQSKGDAYFSMLCKII